MKTTVLVVLSCAGVTAGFAARRIIKILYSKALLASLCEEMKFRSRPKGFFRLAITGTSSGIGKACKELLKGFDSVEVVCLSRRRTESSNISIDLLDTLSCKNCVDTLSKTWFQDGSNPAHNIVLHNAGIFTSTRASDVWRVNAITPCVMTEALCTAYQGSVRDGSLRFVYVGSRLEKRSNLDESNIVETVKAALMNDSSYQKSSAYADTKRAIMLHTSYMCKKYKDSVSFGVVTPGMVNTNIGRTTVSPILWWITAPLRFLFLRHPIEGAVAVLHVAFSDLNGMYFADPKEILESIPDTRDSEGGRRFSGELKNAFS